MTTHHTLAASTDASLTLLVVWHSRTGTAEALAAAAAHAAVDVFSELAVTAEVVTRRAADATSEDVITADGYVFVCPENLASMSGEMKEFIDRTYYEALDRISGRPYVLVVAAGTDGHGVVRQFDRIAAGWRLRRVAEPLVVITGADTAETIAAVKVVGAEQLDAAGEIGATIAAGLSLGLH